MKTYLINPIRLDHTSRVIAFVALAFVLLCALTRAHAQTADKATTNPTGVYTLVSVDGKNVPCPISHDGTAMSVQAGTFTITTNGQITSVMTISMGDRKNIRVERTATYAVKNSELTMKWQNAGVTKGRVAGQTFTMTNEGLVYVYRR